MGWWVLQLVVIVENTANYATGHTTTSCPRTSPGNKELVINMCLCLHMHVATDTTSEKGHAMRIMEWGWSCYFDYIHVRKTRTAVKEATHRTTSSSPCSLPATSLWSFSRDICHVVLNIKNASTLSPGRPLRNSFSSYTWLLLPTLYGHKCRSNSETATTALRWSAIFYKPR